MRNREIGRKGLRWSALLGVVVVASCSQSGSGQVGCFPTEADALGPFYVAGTAVTDNLNRFGKSGDDVLVEGMVLSSADDHAPVAGASIEVWQTDGAGDYFPEDNGHVDDYDDQDIDLRGTVETDEQGAYRFRTVAPGAYFPRPRHWHYRITGPGYQTLVTQLYVTGDGTIRQPGGDCRHAALEATDQGFLYAAPTVYLQPE